MGTSASASTPTTWRRSSAEHASSSRATHGCRERSAGTRSTRARCSAGWRPTTRLVEVAPPPRSELDDRIASYVAERIPNRATIQTGIGSIPNAILAALRDHRELGVHTELISDGLMDLVERGVVNGVAKQLNRTKTVGTFALGTQQLYEFLDENTALELWPVRYVNDPRVIAQEDGFVSINSTISVDLMGQCASETVHGEYYSSSGGQADFARGAMYSKGGQGFVVLRVDRQGRHGLQDRRRARTGRRRDDAEEHRRQGGHGVGGGGAARPVAAGAGGGAHRDRTPRPPGPPDPRRTTSRSPLAPPAGAGTGRRREGLRPLRLAGPRTLVTPGALRSTMGGVRNAASDRAADRGRHRRLGATPRRPCGGRRRRRCGAGLPWRSSTPGCRPTPCGRPTCTPTTSRCSGPRRRS